MSLKPEIVGIVPGGSMGEAMALVAARRGYLVNVCQREGKRDGSEVNKYSPNIHIVHSIEEAVCGADILVIASRSQKFEEQVREALVCLPTKSRILITTKGLQIGTNRRMSQILEDLDPSRRYDFGVLSGPNLASGIKKGDITGTIIASYSPEVSYELKDRLGSASLVIEEDDDVVGVELGGAFKNLVALFAGMLDELKVSANTKAFYVTQLFNECAEIAVRQGADWRTLTNLAWVGDTLLCTADNESRNHRAGEHLVKHPGSARRFLTDELWLAEGIFTTGPAWVLARASGMDIDETPYLNLLNNIVLHGEDPKKAINELMGKQVRGFRGLRSPRFYADRVIGRLRYMALGMSKAIIGDL